MNNGTKRRNLGLIGLLALVAFAVAVLVAMMPAGASTTGDAYPGSGDWIVDNQTRVIDEALIVDGDLVVNNVLELWNVTIWFDLGNDNQYKVNVTTSGNLKANDTLLSSTRTYRHYGFTVFGEMTLKKTTVEEMYDGVRILTKKTVLIQDSRLINGWGGGLHLEDADGTTVNNVSVQADNLRVYGRLSTGANGYDPVYIGVMGVGGAVYVHGGNPKLSDLDVSANGTMYVIAHVEKTDYYGKPYLYCFFPAVGINSDEIDVISDIHVRDCYPRFDVTWYLYNNYSYGGGYWYAYSYGYVSGVNAINYKDVEIKDCSMENLRAGSMSARYTQYGSTYYTYVYTYSRTGILYGASINKKYTSAGPHTSKITMRNQSFENEMAVAVAITPNYDGTLTPTFINEVIIDNVKINRGGQPFMFSSAPGISGMKKVYNTYKITNCTFTNMTGPAYVATRSSGPGTSSNVHNMDYYETILMENCIFRWNRVTSYGLIYEPYADKAEYNNLIDLHVHIKDSKFLDNQGYLIYLMGNWYVTGGLERATIENCLIQNNTGYYMFYYMDRERFDLNGCTIKDNAFNYQSYLYGYGGDGNAKQPAVFRIRNNIIRRSSPSSQEMFYIFWGGDVYITGNNISEMESYFVRTYPYGYYAGECNLYFNENEWTNVNGTLIYNYAYYQYAQDLTIYIEENKAWNTNGRLIEIYEYYAERYEVNPTTYFLNNTFKGFTGSVYRNYGNQIIKGNTFKDCVGYVIECVYLSTSAPTITNNNIIDCENVYYIGAKGTGILKMSLAVSDLNVDCTGNAFYFKNVDATMENVTVSQRAAVAIIADNSNVDAIGSSIPVGSGQVLGQGEINVWFGFELDVEWSNHENPDVSSGVPVADALVVLFGQSGAYYTSAYTDKDGHLRATMIPQWSLRGSFVTVWSPYTVTVAKSGVTNGTTFALDKDYVGEDSMYLLLSDPYIPVIRITSPFEGDLFSAEKVTMRGFSTEIGSGIDEIHVAIGDGEWVKVAVDDNGDFSHTFEDLPEGANTPVRAKVVDFATNENETSVMITIDRTPPSLILDQPENNSVSNVAAITITGSYEPGATITINGLEKDTTDGTLNEPYTLSEGNNTILVVATDRAGNFAMATRNVRLDRFPPTLTVLAPRDGLITRVTNITVEGEVEVGADLFISVYRTTTDKLDERITPRPDGTFSHKVDLDEGENRIVLTAYDNAENEMRITRYVHVDTTAPLCKITSPEDGEVTNKNTIRVLGTAEVMGVTLYLNGKQIHNDGTVDRFVNLNEGENVIVLRAIDSIGNEYADSVMVTLDTEPPEIERLAPRQDHIMVNEDTISVRGKVRGGAASVTVNGIPVSLDEFDMFETSITLEEEGENEVLIVARDLADNVATDSFIVDYSTTMPLLEVFYIPMDTTIESDSANFYISGNTNVGITHVTVTHIDAGGTNTVSVPVASDGTFSVVRNLLEGENTFAVSVTDPWGNLHTSPGHTVTYTYVEPPVEITDTGGIDVGAISLWILVIAIALFVTAVVVTRSLRRERD